MGKNKYLQRQRQVVGVCAQAIKDTYVQYLVDTLALTLHDPKVMGKDTFGQHRLDHVVEAWMERYTLFMPALGGGPEADYCQERLDSQLREIYRSEDEFEPFPERYEWLKEQKTVR